MLVRLKLTKDSCNRNFRKPLYLIPYILTFLNAIFGFLSIVKVFEEQYNIAASFIIIAAFLDALDGRLARAFGSSSYFGMELDSLCDAVSFCLAPTVLMYFWADNILEIESFLFVFSLVFYLCAGLTRLARFNITVDCQNVRFLGLTTTVSALFISSLVLYYKWLMINGFSFLFNQMIITSLICLIAILMVSSIRFYSFKAYSFFKIKQYWKLFPFLFLIIWFFTYGYPILLLLITVYILISLFVSAFNKFSSVYTNKKI